MPEFDLAAAGVAVVAVGSVPILCRTVVSVVALLRADRNDTVAVGLLTGDLFTINCRVREGDGPLTITGVTDLDRATWGSPDADWTIFMASRRTSPEQDLF